MNKKNFILSMTTGLLIANAVFAGDPNPNDREKNDETVISSTTYIKEDVDFDLGFDTADYLPEGFDPYEIYVDLDAVIFLEEEVMDDFDFKKYLPAHFDAYAYPADVQSINYIDENDAVELDFDIHEYLPKGFDPYSQSVRYEDQSTR